MDEGMERWKLAMKGSMSCDPSLLVHGEVADPAPLAAKAPGGKAAPVKMAAMFSIEDPPEYHLGRIAQRPVQRWPTLGQLPRRGGEGGPQAGHWLDATLEMLSEIDRELVLAARAGDAGRLEKALERGADPMAGRAWALQEAVFGRKLEAALALIALVDLASTGHRALMRAAQQGFGPVVPALAAGVDAAALGAVLVEAVGRGRIACAGLLLDAGADAKASNSTALAWAMMGADAELARRLLPLSDPRAWADLPPVGSAVQGGRIGVGRCHARGGGGLRSSHGSPPSLVGEGSPWSRAQRQRHGGDAGLAGLRARGGVDRPMPGQASGRFVGRAADMSEGKDREIERQLMRAVATGDEDGVEECVARGGDLTRGRSWPLAWALIYWDEDAVRALIPWSDPKAWAESDPPWSELIAAVGKSLSPGSVELALRAARPPLDVLWELARRCRNAPESPSRLAMDDMLSLHAAWREAQMISEAAASPEAKAAAPPRI